MNITNQTQKKRPKHNRRSIRLKGYDYSLTGAYFITICVHKRRSLLGSVEDNGVTLSQIGKYVYQCLNQIPNRYDSAELDEFIIMPNHIHAIIIINNDNVGAMDDCAPTAGAQFITPTAVAARFIAPNKRETDKTIQHKSEINKPYNVGAIHELPLQKQRRKMLIPKIMGWFKMNSAKKANVILRKTGQRFWQRNYYDHIVRNENELNRIREYIIYNPMQWQYDRENPDHIIDNNDGNVNQIEEIIYGKKRHSNQAQKPQKA